MIALLEGEEPMAAEALSLLPGPPPPTKTGELSDEDWQEDPVPRKWDKIRAAFLNGKTAEEVQAVSRAMPVRSWLELACKMTQKQIDMPPLQINVVRVELPPQEHGEARVVDVELPPNV
jgi:hypothetical protein